MGRCGQSLHGRDHMAVTQEPVQLVHQERSRGRCASDAWASVRTCHGSHASGYRWRGVACGRREGGATWDSEQGDVAGHLTCALTSPRRLFSPSHAADASRLLLAPASTY